MLLKLKNRWGTEYINVDDDLDPNMLTVVNFNEVIIPLKDGGTHSFSCLYNVDAKLHVLRCIEVAKDAKKERSKIIRESDTKEKLDTITELVQGIDKRMEILECHINAIMEAMTLKD